MSTYLDGLPMFPKDVNAYDSLVEIRVRTLCNIIVQVLLVAEGVHPLEDEFEESIQVFWAWASHKDIRVPMGQCSRDSQAQCSGFTTSTSSRECHSRAQGLLRDGVYKSEYCLSLICRFGKLDKLANWFCVCETVFEVLEL